MDKRVKHRDPEKSVQAVAQLYAAVAAGELSLGQGVRAMRRISGLTQAEFAKHRSISLQGLRLIERDAANPTVETLNKVASIFNLRVGWVTNKLPHQP
jgi:DNA-binding XRE family transcriptional regulator